MASKSLCFEEGFIYMENLQALPVSLFSSLLLCTLVGFVVDELTSTSQELSSELRTTESAQDSR